MRQQVKYSKNKKKKYKIEAKHIQEANSDWRNIK